MSAIWPMHVNKREAVLRRIDVKAMLENPPPEFTGWVYLIGGKQGPLKIGWSKDPWKRAHEFQTGNFQTLHVYAKREGTQADEREIHERLKDHRVRGEWFERWVALDEFRLPLDLAARKDLGAVETDVDEETIRAFIKVELRRLLVTTAEQELDQVVNDVRTGVFLENWNREQRLAELEECVTAVAEQALRDDSWHLSKDVRNTLVRYCPFDVIQRMAGLR